MPTPLLILIIVVAVIAAWVVVRRAKARQSTGSSEPSRMFAATGQREGTNLMRLKLGDHVTITDHDIELWRVNEVWRYEEDGSVWMDYLIGGDGGTRWLSVEDEGTLETSLFEAREHRDVTDSDRLTVDGVAYEQEESGTASYRVERESSDGTSGTMQYAEFVGADDDDALLSLERYRNGGEWSAWSGTTGRTIPPTSIQVYPCD